MMDERAGYRVSAGWGHVGVLEGGGHICELALNSVPGVNPLWRPQWTTMDPEEYSPGKHLRKYGPPPDGKLLAGIAGHSLSFDHFGPPSAEETAAGLSTHGEAPATMWKLLKDTARTGALRYGCRLNHAQIDFKRSIALDPADAVVYCEEEAENLSLYDRPICWNEHVTFGPPFLECNTTVFDMPATRAVSNSADYSDQMFIKADAEFVWPEAPGKNGGVVNLRTTPDETFEHYTSQLLDPKLEVAFVSACNPRLGLLVVYAFRRADFPWVGNWEERLTRTVAPWKGRAFCRGIEFSSTPFAIPRRETVSQGPVFGEGTYRWLPAKSKVALRYLITMFKVPADFGGVQKFAISKGTATVTEAGARRQLKVAVKEFL